MQPLTKFICAYIFDQDTSFYRVFVQGKKNERILRRFINSRLDINRLKAAAQFIDESLFVQISWRELGTLRKAVTEREVRRAMRYERYRDHTCHTLWGFILGCLWFERSAKFRELAGPLTDAKSDVYDDHTFENFAGAWTLGFLCHDIGYLFESDIPAGLTPDPLVDLQSACALLNDFYQSIYVTEFVGVSNVKYVNELRKLGYPIFANNSLALAAENLRQLPLAGIELVDESGASFVVPDDVFDLFKEAGCRDVDSVEEAFRFLYETGKYDQKFLDHGICSGLLMAQLLILGYGLYMISRVPPSSVVLDADFVSKVKDKTGGTVPLTAAMIRTRVPWIFAAARHNLDLKWWAEDPKIPNHAPPKIAAADDFPSFLVTLMDTIQDWDRPRMNSNTKIDDFIMDSTDLKMELEDDRLRIRGRNDYAKKRLAKLEADLEERLIHWRDFVTFG